MRVERFHVAPGFWDTSVAAAGRGRAAWPRCAALPAQAPRPGSGRDQGGDAPSPPQHPRRLP